MFTSDLPDFAARYTVFVPALGLVKITDVPADAVTTFLSNRIEVTRYEVRGTDGSVWNGDEWLRGPVPRGYQESVA